MFLLTIRFILDEISKKATFVYQGLRAIAGLKPQTGDSESFVGILSRNSLCKDLDCITAL